MLHDLTGSRFHRLLVLEQAGRDGGGYVLWRCLCDCGQEKVTSSRLLRIGGVKSCGCWRRERFTRHGMSAHPLYGTWTAIIDRCTNEKRDAYKNYGGRGIKICDEWRHDFPAFLEYVGERPEGCTLDRINNDGNYEPGNVRWANRKTQGSNKRQVISNVAYDELLAENARLRALLEKP